MAEDKAEELARERQEFEKWAKAQGQESAICCSPNAGDAYGEYVRYTTQQCWEAWQASAALLRPHLGERERCVKIMRDEFDQWDYSDLADNNKSDLELFVDNVIDQIRRPLPAPPKEGEGR